MEKLSLFWKLLHEGEAVSDPAKWKSHQVSANQIALVITTLVGIAASFGYKTDLDGQAALAIGGGLVAVVNWVLTLTTSKTVGVKQDSYKLQPVSKSSPETEFVPPANP